MTREEWEGRKARLVDRLTGHAEKATAEADARFGHAQALADQIPMGQPILIGHHSEKRHRRHIAKIDTNMRKGCEAHDKAQYYERRAAAAEANNAIDGRDPDALDKLRAKIDKAQKFQEAMKAANKIIRKKPARVATDAKIAELQGMGFTEANARKAFEPDFCGCIGFPAYALQNNSANIRRMQARISELAARDNRPAVDIDAGGGVKIEEDKDENRLQVFFPGKPSAEVRAYLKARGFRWARSVGAWQRTPGHVAEATATMAAEMYNAEA